MNVFNLHLLGSRQSEIIENVVSFVGEDASGSFGIKARHERCMTSLVFGLARYHCPDEDWQYLAVPGALLYFVDNRLVIQARRYIRDSDYRRITLALTEQLLREEEALAGLKRNLRSMEEELMKKLLDIERHG